MKLTEVLNNLDSVVNEYKSGTWLTKEKLREMLRDLSTAYYLLTKFNIEAYDNWNKLIYNRDINESVAAAKVRADEKHPELRMTRKIMEASKHVLLSMQQELSILKNEDR